VWDEEYVAPLAARGVRGLLSIDITQWRADPLGRTPPPFKLPIEVSSSDELRALVVAQLADYRLRSGAPLLSAERVVAHHVDDDIDLSSERNRSALLVHPPGTWSRRPLAQSSLANLWLASDFAKNPADLATMEGACSAGKLAARALVKAYAPGAAEVVVHELVEELEPPWLKAQQHGFEALVQVLGSFERAARAVDLLLDAGDDTRAALLALEQAPAMLTRSFRLFGLVRMPAISVLGQLQHGLGKLASRVLRRLRPSTYTSAESDIERISRRLRRVAGALQSMKQQ
jgi:hypothetical protein